MSSETNELLRRRFLLRIGPARRFQASERNIVVSTGAEPTLRGERSGERRPNLEESVQVFVSSTAHP
jgi:hypothetical protein